MGGDAPVHADEEQAPQPLAAGQPVFRPLFALFFTHATQGVITMLPFALGAYMVRDFLVRDALLNEAAATAAAPGPGMALGLAHPPAAMSEAAVGRLSGMLGACFCAAQLLTSYPWGRASDTLGRRPVMVIGNISSVVSLAWLGMSGSIASAAAARIAGGLFNAIIGAEKAIIGESLAPPDQAVAFGYFSLAWGLGALVGPALGGTLARPCGPRRPPGDTSDGENALCAPGALLYERPFLLPCLAASLLCLVATILTICVLPETLPAARRGALPAWTGSLPARLAALRLRLRPTRALGSLWRRQAVTRDSPPPAETHGHYQQLATLDAGDPDVEATAAAAAAQHAVAVSGQEAHVRHGAPGGAATLRGGAGGMREDPEAPPADGGGWQDVELPAPRGSEAGAGSQQQQQWRRPDATAEQGSPRLACFALESESPGVLGEPWYRQGPLQRSLAGYGLIALAFSMLDELVPIFASAPPQEGGLGLPPSSLAAPMAASGLVLCAWALLGFPRTHRALGSVRTCRLGLWQSVPMALLIPAASAFLGHPWAVKGMLYGTLSLKMIAATNAFTACLILVNRSAPPGTLGAVNGVGQTIASAVRAAGPALGGLGWAASLAVGGGGSWLGGLAAAGHQALPFVATAALLLATQLIYCGSTLEHL